MTRSPTSVRTACPAGGPAAGLQPAAPAGGAGLAGLPPRNRCLTLYKAMLFALLCWEAGRHSSGSGSCATAPSISPSKPPWTSYSSGGSRGSSNADPSATCPSPGSNDALAVGATADGGGIGLLASLVSEVGRQVGLPAQLGCTAPALPRREVPTACAKACWPRVLMPKTQAHNSSTFQIPWCLELSGSLKAASNATCSPVPVLPAEQAVCADTLGPRVPLQ